MYIFAGIAATFLIALHLQPPIKEVLQENTGTGYSTQATGYLHETAAASTTGLLRVFSKSDTKMQELADKLGTAQDGKYYTRHNTWYNITH
jgi:hypothetical protein